MKNKTYCASLLLLSSTSLYASDFYSVKKGDNLNVILNRFIDYGVGPSKSALYQDILKYNQFIKNPNLIYPGQKISLPELHDVVYEVKKGETFNGIVEKHRQLAPHLTLRRQIQRTIAANPQIKDVNLLEVGDKITLGKVIHSSPTKDFAFYKVKKGDSFTQILTNFYTGVDTNQALSYVKALNPQITNFDLIEPEQVIKLPSQVYVQDLIGEYVQRVVASVKRIQPRYFYPDELGFEIKKMDNEDAGKYISALQKLTKTDSPEKWKDIVNDVREMSASAEHENIERAFYLYSIDIEEDNSVARVRGEVKEFLKVWKDAREKRFKL
jgi:LysM repeat protein